MTTAHKKQQKLTLERAEFSFQSCHSIQNGQFKGKGATYKEEFKETKCPPYTGKKEMNSFWNEQNGPRSPGTLSALTRPEIPRTDARGLPLSPLAQEGGGVAVHRGVWNCSCRSTDSGLNK